MQRTGFVLLLLFIVCSYAADDLVKISDAKALKKLLKSRTNVFIIYTQESPSKKLTAEYTELAGKLRGKGTIGMINCKENKATKKICEENLQTERTIKFYKEGEFVKDYTRPLTYKSMERFVVNPSGDAPWYLYFFNNSSNTELLISCDVSWPVIFFHTYISNITLQLIICAGMRTSLPKMLSI